MTYVQRKHLLLSSTYNLNPSFTKQARVGAGFHLSGELTPLIELRASHPPSCFSMSSKGWFQFKSEIEKITSFFAGVAGGLQLLECEEFYIHFTHSFNQRRVILMDKITKTSRFSMCATTFLVLKSIRHCLDQRLRELLIQPIEFFRKCIVKTIAETIASSGGRTLDTNNVKVYIKKNCEQLME